MAKELIAHIKQYISINDQEAESIIQHTSIQDVPKKEILLKEGQICTHSYYVAKGCIRMYFINERGVEQVTQFAIEGWWLTDNMSLLKNAPSDFCIQAVENSTVIALSKENQDILSLQIPLLEKYMRIVLQHAYAAAQMRIKFLYSMSKEEHYKRFLAAYPEFAQRIPQYMLASFLGFTPEYLSELRKKIT
ncbi:MAG: Crp/Fnr family transcriptional regulator [Flavipsychrobacter sp.]